ncbi:MAG: hypothetical protein HQL52_12970 [Magnetococcales bacterium]|nr:hypothetical protein [Magnetococcales bacterium]
MRSILLLALCFVTGIWVPGAAFAQGEWPINSYRLEGSQTPASSTDWNRDEAQWNWNRPNSRQSSGPPSTATGSWGSPSNGLQEPTARPWGEIPKDYAPGIPAYEPNAPYSEPGWGNYNTPPSSYDSGSNTAHPSDRGSSYPYSSGSAPSHSYDQGPSYDNRGFGDSYSNRGSGFYDSRGSSQPGGYDTEHSYGYPSGNPYDYRTENPYGYGPENSYGSEPYPGHTYAPRESERYPSGEYGHSPLGMESRPGYYYDTPSRNSRYPSGSRWNEHPSRELNPNRRDSYDSPRSYDPYGGEVNPWWFPGSERSQVLQWWHNQGAPSTPNQRYPGW